jgi:putative ABC transport system permease protein
VSSSHIALAWLNLTYHKRRFTVSLLGIAFAVVLMYMEVGFLNALYDSQVELLRWLNADLILTSKAKYTMTISDPLPRHRLYQARAVAGVAGAYPLYVDFEQPSWKNPDEHNTRPIRVLGFDPDDPVFLLPEVQSAAEALKLPDTALIDARSKDAYGRREAGVVTELARRSIRVVGTFRVGTDFLSDGNVIMSDKNFLKFFPSRRAPGPSLSRVELGLIKVEPGARPQAVADGLRQALPDDVQIATKNEFIHQELVFWQGNTPLGYVFGLGSALGFVVGVVICYQILYTDVMDHLPQFATLKAIGYRDGFLRRVVLQQALILSLAGFLPGLIAARLLYEALAVATGLPMRLTLARAGLVLSLTLVMCLLAGLIALRKATAADPAEVFA